MEREKIIKAVNEVCDICDSWIGKETQIVECGAGAFLNGAMIDKYEVEMVTKCENGIAVSIRFHAGNTWFGRFFRVND